MILGGLCIYLTHATTKILFRCQQVAFLAAVLTLSHPAIIVASPRSMPDIVLAFGICLSTYGFLKLLLQPGDQAWKAILAVYIGAGIAISSKGLPGVLFLGVALAAMLLFDRAIRLETTRSRLGRLWCCWRWMVHRDEPPAPGEACRPILRRSSYETYLSKVVGTDHHLSTCDNVTTHQLRSMAEYAAPPCHPANPGFTR